MASKRKRPRQAIPTDIGILGDLHDYKQPPFKRASRARVDEDAPIVVTDDWPDFVPITEAELRVMESHFAEELDELFGPLR
jgi:hypothetical protein